MLILNVDKPVKNRNNNIKIDTNIFKNKRKKRHHKKTTLNMSKKPCINLQHIKKRKIHLIK